MINDKRITISTAGSRYDTQWPASTLMWSQFIEKLSNPVRSTETINDYLKLNKKKQDDLKDVGGYIGGVLLDNKRKAANILGRDLLTLDMDNIPSGQTNAILCKLDSLGVTYVVYSTRKHRPDAPRLRAVFPTNRTCTAEEYEPLCRKLAEYIGIEYCDPTTFQVHRLMYWPSCCKDGVYIFNYADKPFINVDGMLALYMNWWDVTQ